MLSIGGDNLQFYPNFALFSTSGGMNLDHDFSQVSKLREDQKKKFSPKLEEIFFRVQVKTKKKVFSKIGRAFSPNSSVADRLQVIQMQTWVKLLGGMQM